MLLPGIKYDLQVHSLWPSPYTDYTMPVSGIKWWMQILRDESNTSGMSYRILKWHIRKSMHLMCNVATPYFL